MWFFFWKFCWHIRQTTCAIGTKTSCRAGVMAGSENPSPSKWKNEWSDTDNNMRRPRDVIQSDFKQNAASRESPINWSRHEIVGLQLRYCRQIVKQSAILSVGVSLELVCQEQSQKPGAGYIITFRFMLLMGKGHVLSRGPKSQILAVRCKCKKDPLPGYEKYSAWWIPYELAITEGCLCNASL